MTDTTVITRTPKNGDVRPRENPTQTFINGSWHNTDALKNLSLQRKLRNYKT